MNADTIKNLFLTLLSLKFIIELFLNRRNEIYIKKHEKAVPDKFKEKISLDNHQKASRYSREKLRFSRIQLVIEFALLYFWTIGGGLNYFSTLVQKYTDNVYLQSTLFIIIFGFVTLLISLPSELYLNFKIEEKYGFNKMTLKLYFTDMIKSILISLLIGVPFFLLLIYLIETFSHNWWIIAFVCTCLFQFILLWIYPTILAPLFNKFTPLNDGELKKAISQLAENTKFSFSEIFTMDASKRSSHGNAYFTGFGKNKRIVFFDTLIQTLSTKEVVAVLAHELGHFKKNHIKKMLIKSIIFSLIGFYLIFVAFKSQLFFNGHGVSEISSYILLILFSLISPIYLFFMTPINSYLSRKNEFEADLFASQNSDYKDLISALIKMYEDNASTLTPDPIYAYFYYSHPSALERVKFLESTANQEG